MALAGIGRERAVAGFDSHSKYKLMSETEMRWVSPGFAFLAFLLPIRFAPRQAAFKSNPACKSLGELHGVWLSLA